MTGYIFWTLMKDASLAFFIASFVNVLFFQLEKAIICAGFGIVIYLGSYIIHKLTNKEVEN